MLRELSDRQSDVRELFMQLREMQDKTQEEAIAGNLGYDDDAVIAVVLATKEYSRDPASSIEIGDLIWAGGFLDYLDTQGFGVYQKQFAESAPATLSTLAIAPSKKEKKGGRKRRK